MNPLEYLSRDLPSGKVLQLYIGDTPSLVLDDQIPCMLKCLIESFGGRVLNLKVSSLALTSVLGLRETVTDWQEQAGLQRVLMGREYSYMAGAIPTDAV